MNYSGSGINKINSLYCIKNIVSYIRNNIKLNLFKYNKNLRAKLDISNYSYEKYILLNSIYNKIKETKKIKCYYNYKHKSILNLLKYNDELINNKIIEEFFLDIYQMYSKEIEVFIDLNNIKLEIFENFILIKSPFKLILKIDIDIDKFEKNKITKILKYKNIIKGFKFKFQNTDDDLYDLDLSESFIKIFKFEFKNFNNLEYISIPIELINKIDFSENKFKFIKLICYYHKEYNIFFNELVKKYITKNLEGLIIKFFYENISYDTKIKIKKLKLRNFPNLRTLKLKDLPNECLIDKNTLQTINNLSIISTNIIYKNTSVYFNNLKSLCIDGISFKKFFEDNEDYSFLSNLEILKIEKKNM